jgi:hypothetical protein
VAGSINARGYWLIKIKRRTYAAHRLAWLYEKGTMPTNCLDHVNGVKTDNSFCNLREATRKQNQENLCIQKNNTSGFRGVTWDASRGKWMAHITHNSKQKTIGRYDTAEEAAKAAQTKRMDLFTHDYGRDAVRQAPPKSK